MSTLTINLTPDEVSVIVSVLAQRPYIEVYGLIEKIKTQVQPTGPTAITDPGE